MDPGTSSRHQQLTSGKDTRSARCLERGTPGAGGGPRETTGGDTGTRPRAYLTTRRGHEPPTSSLSGKTWQWLDDACCGWAWRLPAYSVAERGLASADDAGCWLLIWLFNDLARAR